ncbi:histidine phosphatase family protein, partial [Patescibacteria group bacterium]
MTTFYLIRHGEKIDRFKDIGLTEKGKLQANKIGKYLRNKKIDSLFSSPYTRTKETAKIINKYLFLNIEIDERLKERTNWENFSPQLLKDLKKEWDYSTKHRHYVPRGGIS